jgi:hypothetical protein
MTPGSCVTSRVVEPTGGRLLGHLHARRHPPLVPQPGRPHSGVVIMTTSHSVDVLVIGAGPTGLTAAGDLARCGRSVVALERRPDANPSSRAFATMARTWKSSTPAVWPTTSSPRTEHPVFPFSPVPERPDASSFGYQFVAVTQTNVDHALADYAKPRNEILRGIEAIAPNRIPMAQSSPPNRRTTIQTPPDMAGYVIGATRTAPATSSAWTSRGRHVVLGSAGRRQAGRRAHRLGAHPRQQPRGVRFPAPTAGGQRRCVAARWCGIATIRSANEPVAPQRSSMCSPGRWDVIRGARRRLAVTVSL